MRYRILSLNLSKKLTFLTLALCVFAIFAILVRVYITTVQVNERIFGEELSLQKSYISLAYVEALWSFDTVQINEISNALLSNNGFASMIALKVIDSHGNILFYKSTPPQNNTTFEHSSTFTKTAMTEVKKNGEILGKVYFTFSTKGIIGKYQNELSAIFIFAFFVLAFISIWINIFFKKLLTEPLNKLLYHIKQIRNENYETNNIESLPPEMQQISNALNYTSHLIKKRNYDLKNHSENLERMVAERTRELESQVIKNMNASRLVAVGEVASGIAHEINNPLTVINGQIIKLKRQLKDNETIDKSEFDASLAKISQMNERIVKIINGLKLISRDGQSDPMIEFSLLAMLEYIKLLTEMKIKSININLDIEIGSGIDLVFGREVQISQVIVNLVNNSVDAISLLENKWIKIVVRDQADFVEFSITDSGAGISKDVREKIMQPFFTTKEVGKGTGLGLSISKGIIIDHGGQFLYNEESPNTQFVFSINKFSQKKLVA